MKKNLVFIASNDNLYHSEPFISFLENFEEFEIKKINNYFDAEKNLSEIKVDLIFLRPDYLNWKERTKENETENQKQVYHKEYIGRKILTDIIRKENSINYDTPVYMEILGQIGRGENYSKNAYLSLGATHVFENSVEVREFLKIINSDAHRRNHFA